MGTFEDAVHDGGIDYGQAFMLTPLYCGCM
jgi:hypothetical protein